MVGIGVGIPFYNKKKKQLWTPSSISTGVWYDAFDASTITKDASNYVSQWNDKSGNNLHLTQTQGAYQPQYDTANKRLFFATDYLIFPEEPNIFGKSIFIVADTNAGLAGDGNVISRSSRGTTARNVQIRLRTGNTGIVGNPALWGNEGYYNDTKTGTDIVSYIADNNLSVYTNGSLLGTTTATSSSLIVNTVGCWVDLGNNYPFNGYIKEIVIANGILSEENRQKMEGYLAHKWGLTANLSVSHPYKTSSPYV